MKMLKAGVPSAAVQAKMLSEGVDPKLLDDASDKRSSPPVTSSSATCENYVNIEKYSKMVKAGVPVAAVKAKMTIEGVDASLLGLQQSQNSSLVQQATASVPLKAKVGELSGPKLVGLHWEPLDDEKLRSRLLITKLHSHFYQSPVKNSFLLFFSFFGNLICKESSLPSDEMKALVSMFERKDGVGTKGNLSKRPIEALTPRSKKRRGPTVIDMSRSTNVAICLSSFKSRGIGPDQLAAAVDKFDLTALSFDDLLRIKEILPSDTEIKSLVGRVSESPDKYDTLHESEKCLYRLAIVPNLKDKIQSMIFVLSFQVLAY
jgi:hypothetical protein